MLAEGRFSLRLFAAFSVIALAFVASSVYASWRSLEIESETYALTANALPSIDHLTTAIDALRDLESASDEYADMTPAERTPAGPHIRELWRVVDAEIGTYTALPTFPGEHRLYDEVPASLRELDTAVAGLFAEADSGSGTLLSAERNVRDRSNKAASLLRYLVRFNVEHALDSSRRISATRHGVAIMAAALNVTTLLFTFLVALWIGGSSGPTRGCSASTPSWSNGAPASSRSSDAASRTISSRPCRR